MRTALILLLTLSASVAYGQTVKIGNKAPAKGSKWTEEKTSVAKLTVEMKGQKVPMTINEVEKKIVEVLDTKADVVSKAKITYAKKSKVQNMGGKDTPEPTTLEGKTYTLTAGTPVTVEPAADADAVRKAEKRFGQPDRIRLAVGGREYTKGKSVDIAAAAGNDMFGDDAEVTKFAIELVGLEGKNARFNVKVEANTKGKLPMHVELTGKVLVDPDTADALEMDLSGTMKSTGTGEPKVDGTMTMTGRRQK